MLQPEVVDNVQGISQLGFRHLFWRALHFLNFDVVFPGQPAQGFGVGKVFVLLQKGDRVARFAAAKTLENVARRVHVERRCGMGKARSC